MAFIGLEIIQGCVQVTGEAFVAPLAFPVLDVFVFTPFTITDQRVDTLIGDAEIVTLGIGTGVPFSREMFLATTRAFALGVGTDSSVGLQDRQRDPGFATWTVIRRPWFPFSGTVFFEELTELFELGFDGFSMREQQGDGKQQDQDLCGAQGEKMHRIGKNRIEWS